MLSINKFTRTELKEIRIACSYLFSPELARSDEFLKELDLASIQDAFREKRERYDPGLHMDEPEDILERRRERFEKINESCAILNRYIPEGEKPVSVPTEHQAKVIAVGGAKGGIGKSMFAANLGVLLSSKGKQTVIVDLDLGGANLHLYLGENFLKYNINDYLHKKVGTLKEIMVQTRYGPDLIGGGSSQLGAANINFARKLKLLRDIKKIDADYIILDLGGDTSYNIIDFFLAAHHGLVLTTCDPASYLSAYNFIKVALYRKLNRIFGPESEFRSQRDRDLERLIKEVTTSATTNGGRLVEMLMERINEEQPRNLSLIKKVLEVFQPNIVVNMIRDDSDAMGVVNRIQDVSQRMLSIQIGYFGAIPYQTEMERSAQDLVPVVARYPKGDLSETLSHMIDKILNAEEIAALEKAA